jgi:hypothetical protein
MPAFRQVRNHLHANDNNAEWLLLHQPFRYASIGTLNMLFWPVVAKNDPNNTPGHPFDARGLVCYRVILVRRLLMRYCCCCACCHRYHRQFQHHCSYHCLSIHSVFARHEVSQEARIGKTKRLGGPASSLGILTTALTLAAAATTTTEDPQQTKHQTWWHDMTTNLRTTAFFRRQNHDVLQHSVGPFHQHLHQHHRWHQQIHKDIILRSHCARPGLKLATQQPTIALEPLPVSTTGTMTSSNICRWMNWCKTNLSQSLLSGWWRHRHTKDRQSHPLGRNCQGGFATIW